MTDWIPCGNDFIEADVIRWREGIWAPHRRRRQTKPWGEQEVTGQIVAVSDRMVSVKVMKAELTETFVAAELKPYLMGMVIRKKPATLRKGSVERLPWSDESARALVASRFRSPQT